MKPNKSQSKNQYSQFNNVLSVINVWCLKYYFIFLDINWNLQLIFLNLTLKHGLENKRIIWFVSIMGDLKIIDAYGNETTCQLHVFNEEGLLLSPYLWENMQHTKWSRSPAL